MRWFKPALTGGGTALFGASAAVPPSRDVRISEIRDRMLACIKSADAVRFPHVAHRIRFAPDVEALWFLRGDLMALLASSQGEEAALRRIAAISAMFESLLPEGLRSRPSCLNSRPRQ
jgi:hypothetical protein